MNLDDLREEEMEEKAEYFQKNMYQMSLTRPSIDFSLKPRSGEKPYPYNFRVKLASDGPGYHYIRPLAADPRIVSSYRYAYFSYAFERSLGQESIPKLDLVRFQFELFTMVEDINHYPEITEHVLEIEGQALGLVAKELRDHDLEPKTDSRFFKNTRFI